MDVKQIAETIYRQFGGRRAAGHFLRPVAGTV